MRYSNYLHGIDLRGVLMSRAAPVQDSCPLIGHLPPPKITIVDICYTVPNPNPKLTL